MYKPQIIFVVLLIFAALVSSAQGGEHDLFTSVLQSHVRDGLVNYTALCNDNRLGNYIEQISSKDPDSLSARKAKMAFWINAYNAYTLKIICDNYPLKSITELHTGGPIIRMMVGKTVWDKKLVIINKKKLSLNHIEHKILRPTFKDPRIHFALVCAAKGCPPLRSEAYEANMLNTQLMEQGVIFLSQENKNHFDLSTKTAYLSSIFSWFKKDFTSSDKNILQALYPFLPKNIADEIMKDLSAWKVRYTFYDWNLNEQ